MLNNEQIQILQAINEGTLSDEEIAKRTNLSIELVRYHLGEFEKNDYLKLAHSRDYKGNLSYVACILKPKGKVAATQPEKLLNPPSSIINNLSITESSINAPIGIFQQATGNTFNANQDIDTKISDALKLIDSFYLTVESLPDNERELSIVHLDNLKEEIQSPNRRDPKKIRAYFVAFLSIAATFISFMANATDFVNNATDFGERIGIEIPQLPKP